MLCPEFEHLFEKLIIHGEAVESAVVKKAKQRKFFIKELFIEFGYPLDKLEDLKACVDFLIELEKSPTCGDTVDQNCKDIVC